jgi:hypothetical protein
MKRFEHIIDLYRLGLIHRIRSFHNGDRINDRAYDLFQCTVQLSAFINYPFNAERFPASVRVAALISKQLVDYWNALDSEDDATLHDVDTLMRRLTEFETLLRHEIDNLNMFVLEDVGIFNTSNLIDDAEQHLSSVALQFVNDEVKADIKAAGRCLAFDLYTACGFHAVRALEATARIYYKRVTEKDPAQNDRPLGGMANDLRDVADDVHGHPPQPRAKDDPLRLIISNLDRINNIYRKPITHPEMVLKTLDDGKNVFDLAAVSINLIAEQQLIQWSR